jgi:hypothetical protein
MISPNTEPGRDRISGDRMTSPYLANPSAYPRARRSPSRYPLHAGKIPARVIEYLVSYGAGVEKSTMVICDDLDIDARQFAKSITAAVRRGVVVKRLDGGVNLWSVRASPAREEIAA